MRWEATGDIIHAEGVRVWFHIIRAAGAQDWRWRRSDREVWSSLSGLDGPFDLMTEITEVVWIDAQAEHFIDHGKKVRQ